MIDLTISIYFWCHSLLGVLECRMRETSYLMNSKLLWVKMERR